MIRTNRLSRRIALALGVLTFVICVTSHTIVDSVVSAKSTGWITRSNENTNLLVKAESNSNCTNQTTSSDALLQLDAKFVQCYDQTINNTIKTLQTKLDQETDSAVKIDLEILINAATQELKSEELDRQYRLPYVNLPKEIAESINDAFEKSTQTALAQLKRYAGVDSTPIATLATTQIQNRLKQPNQFFPEKSELEKDLANTTVQIERIKTLFDQRRVNGYQDAYAKLKTQLNDYAAFVRQTVLPSARTSFRLPPELYAAKLAERGVEIGVDELVGQARSAFQTIQQQMDQLAPQVAKQKGFSSTGYREVIRALKQEQLPANQILDHYQQRQKQIEAIVRREKLVTLPDRSLTIRLTNDRENSSFPVPQYFPPRRSQKTAGVFIIPLLKEQTKPSARTYDDFTYPAVSWTLTAHEGRPGHDLQFTTIQDKGTSEARSRFGYNPANHEGWALYAETITLPFMSIEGQFISLQFQLLRAARAFLEPELHLGRISPDEALRVLTEDVGFSKFFAQQELRRYTTFLPGHAPSYFYGYQRLMQLRTETEQKLGKQFNQQKFHDFVLAQGFMPQRFLRQAVVEQFLAK